jgi:hypothetical protein
MDIPHDLFDKFTNLRDCQSRKQTRLDFHFNASLAALNLAKLDMIDKPMVLPLPLSIATYQRQAQNRCFLELIISILDIDQTFVKSHFNYKNFLQHGSLSF